MKSLTYYHAHHGLQPRKGQLLFVVVLCPPWLTTAKRTPLWSGFPCNIPRSYISFAAKTATVIASTTTIIPAASAWPVARYITKLTASSEVAQATSVLHVELFWSLQNYRNLTRMLLSKLLRRYHVDEPCACTLVNSNLELKDLVAHH